MGFSPDPVKVRILPGSYQDPATISILARSCRILPGSYQVPSRFLSGSFQVPIRILPGSYQGPSRFLSGSFQVSQDPATISILARSCRILTGFYNKQDPNRILKDPDRIFTRVAQFYSLYAVDQLE